MQETTNVQPSKAAGRSIVWDALIPAATGALLAVLVCVPYDRLFGFSEALCVNLRYAASVAVLATCLTGCRLAEPPLVLQVGTL